MPAFHVTLFFTQNEKYGWVEQFWRQDDTPQRAIAASVRLAEARFKLLGAGVSIPRVRVCLDGLPRACASSLVNGRPLSAPAYPPTVGLDIRIQSGGTPGHWRNYCMRGLPLGSILTDGPVTRFGPLVANAAASWLQLLVTDGWQLRIEQSVGPELPIVGITQFSLVDRDIFGDPLNEENPDPATTFCVGAVNGEGIPDAPLVKIRNVKAVPSLAKYRQAINGTHPVAFNAVNAVFWHGTFGGADSMKGGFLQMVKEVCVPIRSASVVRMVSRKVGPAKELPEIGQNALAALFAAANPATPPVDFVGPPAPFPPPSPPLTTITTARDLAQQIWQGYSPPGPEPVEGIGIAQVAGRDRPTYLVLLAGIDNDAGKTAKQWANAFSSGFGLPDTYTSKVRALVKGNTPPGAELIFAGHSFGGMVAQWMNSLFPAIGEGREPINIITFGSPLLSYGIVGPRPKQFCVRGDLLTYGPPVGNYTWLGLNELAVLYYAGTATERINSLLAYGSISTGTSIFGYITVDPGDTPLDPYTRHMCYPNLESLDEYSWNGIKLAETQAQPLVIGPVTRYSWIAP